jgi:4-hydroxy-tetrahydrodipicolinate synthase
MTELAPEQLVGSLPPLVTPFRDGRIDLDTYEALVEFQVSNRSHGVVVCGTTGEPSTLTVDERRALLEAALRAAAGRIPVVAATGSQSLAETAALTDHAQRAGAAALLVVTPYYVRPPARGLVEYVVTIAARTELPVLLYHIPARTGVSVQIDALARMVEAAPNLVGMKHAAADLGLVSDALHRFGPDFRLLAGLEELSLPMLALGAAGMVNAVSNVAPALVVSLYDAVASGDLQLARRRHFELLALNRAVFLEPNPIPMKYLMKRVGLLADNEHRLPMVPADPKLEERLDAVLADAGLLPSMSP